MKLIAIKLLFLTVIAISIIILFNQKPSHSRDWVAGFDVFPHIEINDNEITIKNLRDWTYEKDKVTGFNYKTETYNPNNLTQAYFLVEPFSKWDGIAHTYFVFEFSDKEPIAFSVEARREKDEKYSALLGFFNQYELIYIWGTEKDLQDQRIVMQGNDIYKYPLIISNENTQKLFVHLAEKTQELEENPQFYNTISKNCTNILADFANDIAPNHDAIPSHYARYFPGYSDELLYKLGYIPNDKPLKEIKEMYYVNTN